MNPRSGGETWSSDGGLGGRIAKLRIDGGFTQRALATAIGVDNGYLSHVENSKRAPSLAVLISISQALGTTVLFLVTGSDSGLCPFCGRDC